MLSASHRIGYRDKKTGRIEKLPLSTMDYDPEVKGLEMLLGGYEMFIWKYSVSHCGWGRMKPWKPDNKSKATYNAENFIGNKKGLKDLSVKERKMLLSMLKKKKTAKEISETLNMNYLGVQDIRYRYNAGKLKK